MSLEAGRAEVPPPATGQVGEGEGGDKRERGDEFGGPARKESMPLGNWEDQLEEAEGEMERENSWAN